MAFFRVNKSNSRKPVTQPYLVSNLENFVVLCLSRTRWFRNRLEALSCWLGGAAPLLFCLGLVHGGCLGSSMIMHAAGAAGRLDSSKLTTQPPLNNTAAAVSRGAAELAIALHLRSISCCRHSDDPPPSPPVLYTGPFPRDDILDVSAI